MTTLPSTDINQAIEQARSLLASLEQARSLNNAVQAAERQTRTHLTSLFRMAKADAVIADIVPEELLQFVSRPHLVRQIGHGKRWEVLVPKLFKLSDVGWPVREEGQYMVYLVSPFVSTVMDIAPSVYEMIPDLEKPDFTAQIEGDELVVVEGDPDEVFQKIGGKKAVAERKGMRLRLKAQARFNVYADLIRMGVLPWSPNPIPASLRRQPKVDFELRDYQQADYDEWLRYGAMGLYAYGGTGKTFFGMRAMAEVVGPKVVFAPNTILLEQWQKRLELYAPHVLDETTFLTYASLQKAMKQKWSLAIFDEVHRLVATTYIEAAYIQTATRLGMSATPVRTDGREDLIAALCGKPGGVRWPIADIAKPVVTVWIVRNDAEKLRKAVELARLPHRGKVLVYADHIAVGETVAGRLGVPFAHGKTKDPYEVVRDNSVVVVSRIGDLGLSFDIERIIQVDYAGRSQAQEGQRALRAGHETDAKARRTEMHILATPDQWRRFVAERTLIYKRWGIDVDVRVSGAMSEREVLSERPALPRVSRRPAAPRPLKPSRAVSGQPASAALPAQASESQDEVAQVLAVPGVQARVKKAESSVGMRTAPYIQRVFRLCYSAAFRPDEITEGRGITDVATLSRFRSACKALLAVGLFADAGEGRYTVNQSEIARLRTLAGAMKG